MTFARRVLVAIAATALLAATVAAGLSARADKSERPSGATIAHRNGGLVKAGSLPRTETYSVGGHALEPTVALDKEGRIFYAAAGFDQVGNLPKTEILRSEDKGKSWTIASPRVLGVNTMPITLDPYVWVDEGTGRVFTIDLTVACSYLSFSDDQGATWITNPLSCGRPVNDHQSLFGGPPAVTPMQDAVYPNVLYYCWNDIASSSCSKSIDGGVAFHPTGTPAFQGYSSGEGGGDDFCGGLHGHGVVGADGTVLLPREYCGKPFVAISHDEGVTWSQVQVAGIDAAPGRDPSVTADAKGNLYYVFIAYEDYLPYLVVSKNGGETWSKPEVVSPPGIIYANLATLDVGAPGKVAIAYYGSTNSPDARCDNYPVAPEPPCTEADRIDATFNGYVTMTTDALSKDPLLYTGLVNQPGDPLIRRNCNSRCQWAYDFIDVTVGRDGVPYAAFVDGCRSDCTAVEPYGEDYEGLVAKLVGRPKLN